MKVQSEIRNNTGHFHGENVKWGIGSVVLRTCKRREGTAGQRRLLTAGAERRKGRSLQFSEWRSLEAGLRRVGAHTGRDGVLVAQELRAGSWGSTVGQTGSGEPKEGRQAEPTRPCAEDQRGLPWREQEEQSTL